MVQGWGLLLLRVLSSKRMDKWENGGTVEKT